MFKQKKGEQDPAEVFDLSLSFESGFMILSAGTFRFRLRREDVALMANPSALERAFDGAGKRVNQRIFDGPAIEKYCKIARFLGHGLMLGNIASILGESEEEIREFYNWALSQNPAGASTATAEYKRQADLDILPSLPERKNRLGFEKVETVRLNGRQVKQLLAQDGIDAAVALGVERADLDQWLKDNSAMMALIS